MAGLYGLYMLQTCTLRRSTRTFFLTKEHEKQKWTCKYEKKTVLSDKVGPEVSTITSESFCFLSFFRLLFGFVVFPEMFRNNSESLTNLSKNRGKKNKQETF